MSKRYDKTLADYLVIAVSPALIMTLIGGLVFFLLEVFYRGNYVARLHYILTLFIIAAVLVARIAIEEGSERAAMFALPLAIATMLTINRFVEYHGTLSQAMPESLSMFINLGLIGLIWWCAHKLTWDCTMIDETAVSSGEGLLDATGFGKNNKEEDAGETAIDGSNRAKSADPQPLGRWNYFRDARNKPHSPGVWVVYFSIAALPIFGIGQLFIPAAQVAQRRYAFCLLCVYVASALGLLLTTSFLGLRRYLRQRQLPMPMHMANTWIALGCALILAVMVVALLVPRPNAEYAVSQIPAVMASPDQRASKHGFGREGAQGKQPNHVTKIEQNGKTTVDGKKDSGPNESKSDNPSSDASSNARPDDKPNSDKPNSDKPSDGKSNNDKPQPQSDSSKPSSGDEKQQDSSKHAPNSDKSNTSGQPEQSQNAGNQQSAGNQQAADENAASPPADPSSAIAWFLPAVQWLFYALVLGFGLYWAWRHRIKLLAAMRNLLAGIRSFWETLFGRRKPTKETVADSDARKAAQPFAVYADPFATGMSERLTAEQLVRYTFAALEAWARENGCARELDQTPHEFARNLGRRAARFQQSAAHLANLYCEAVYAPGRMRLSSAQPLEEIWQAMRAEASAPV